MNQSLKNNNKKIIYNKIFKISFPQAGWVTFYGWAKVFERDFFDFVIYYIYHEGVSKVATY